ncbi:TPA: hypothetical protein QFK61_002023 [Enterococcus faecium]|nr:hypothetical protein [Enterococcus faecium]MDQ8450398.1 hypothetical protein [Enterococcus faecium]MDQ8461032.1 hypothetical protein [Enterococcus faecium]MDQ8466073.1 hypothetical protein [Enterococcus faecium]MDQ8543666.1 hypothetical protein [Enterococcus faecium]
MEINTDSTVSLTTFRLRKEYQKELTEAENPSFVQERIDYYAEYLSKGLTYSDLYLLVIAEPDEEELATMFEEIFASPYLEMSYEFMKWYRDPNYWRQRQVEVAYAVICIYQQKTRKEQMIV